MKLIAPKSLRNNRCLAHSAKCVGNPDDFRPVECLPLIGHGKHGSLQKTLEHMSQEDTRRSESTSFSPLIRVYTLQHKLNIYTDHYVDVVLLSVSIQSVTLQRTYLPINQKYHGSSMIVLQ